MTLYGLTSLKERIRKINYCLWASYIPTSQENVFEPLKKKKRYLKKGVLPCNSNSSPSEKNVSFILPKSFLLSLKSIPSCSEEHDFSKSVQWTFRVKNRLLTIQSNLANSHWTLYSVCQYSILRSTVLLKTTMRLGPWAEKRLLGISDFWISLLLSFCCSCSNDSL